MVCVEDVDLTGKFGDFFGAEKSDGLRSTIVAR
jgi:hypothetical protein